MISQSESFDTLTRGFEQAVLQTGGVCKEHRTDNLTAATQASGNKRVFTSRWQDFTNHYGVIPTKNNPGVSHENGKIEKSHDLLKKAIDQELMLRGSRNFGSMAEYEKFLQAIKDKRNWLNRDKFIEEQKALKPLPHRTFNEAILLSVRVNPESLIQVLGVTYSVPTRLISNWLKAYVYRDKIDLFLGSRQVLTLPRLAAGAVIDYRHLIDSLIRKPGAFDAYQHKAYLFPNLILRQAYDALKAHDSATASKRYCEILYLAKMQGEALVSSAVAALMDENKIPLKELIMQIIELSAEPTLVSIDTQISESCLDDYDELLTTSGVV